MARWRARFAKIWNSIPGREHCKSPKIVTDSSFYWKRKVTVASAQWTKRGPVGKRLMTNWKSNEQSLFKHTKMKSAGNWGPDLRHNPVPLRTWPFCKLRLTPAIFKTKMQPYVFAPLCNYATISDIKKSLLNMHPYFLPSSTIIPDQ